MQRNQSIIRFGKTSELFSLIPSEKAIFVTTETLYRQSLEMFSESGLNAKEELHWIRVPDGEACKNFSVLENICRYMIDFDANPDTILVAIGGGSLSDLVGLAAHLWMRGIELVLVPTTLLAMIDASIGGKNAIDIGTTKNLIGSFHLPNLILCDVRWLETLPSRNLLSGMAEAIKHAAIDSEEHFLFLEEIANSGKSLTQIQAELWEELVRRSQQVKIRYVDADPYDNHLRHALNYGHTFGHAIELITGIPHGFAVATGIGMASALAVSLGVLDPDIAARIDLLLRNLGLPTNIKEASAIAGYNISPSTICDLIRADKKRRGESIDFALLSKIGNVRIEPIEIKYVAEFINA